MSVDNDIQKLRKVYKGIDDYCSECDECCFTYGWLMPCEIEKYETLSEIISINDKVFCFDSFKRGKTGEKILDHIPRCKYYKDRRCSINSVKPFDCLLYPVKVIYILDRKKFSVVLSLDCPYVKSLNEESINSLKKKIETFFVNMSPIAKREYFELIKSWSEITDYKDFNYSEILDVSELDLEITN